MKLTNSFTIVAALSLTLFACGEKAKTETKDTTPNVPTVRTEGLKIAYYETDSLNKRFTYLVGEESKMTKKQEKFQKEFEVRQRKLQKLGESIMTHREKMDISGYELQSMEQEYQRQEQSLMVYQQNEGSKIQKEAAEIQEVIAKKVEVASKEYCEKYGIDILLMHGRGGQFGYITPSMDVTEPFIEFVNSKQAEIEADMGKTKK